MTKKLLIIPVSIFALLFSSCAGKQSDSYASPDYTEDYTTEQSTEYEYSEEPEYYDEADSDDGLVTSTMQKSSSAPPSGGSSSPNLRTDDLKTTNVFNAKIIRNADIKFKVENVKTASTKIANMVDMSGGYISNEDLTADKVFYQTIETTEESETKEFEVTTRNIIYVRVPSKNFQKLLSSMKGLSVSEDYVRINAQDVTEEYYDLETRLKTKKEVEARYISILKAKAKTLEEILIAEDRIRVIREEIEAVEGRLNYLKNKVSLSTIQIEIYQDVYYTQETTRFQAFQAPKTSWSFGESAGDAIASGWNGILIFLVGILYLWPLFLIGGFVFWFVRRKIRKHKAQKQALKKD